MNERTIGEKAMIVKRERERESYDLMDAKVSPKDTLFIIRKDKLTEKLAYLFWLFDTGWKIDQYFMGKEE